MLSHHKNITIAQNKEGILPVATLMWPNWQFWGRGVHFQRQRCTFSEAEVYRFRGRGVLINVYKADDKIVTSGATSLAGIDLRKT